MLLLLASATLQAPAETGARVAAMSPATASVRIVRAAEVRADRFAATDESLLRKAQVREQDGSIRTASLIEYY